MASRPTGNFGDVVGRLTLLHNIQGKKKATWFAHCDCGEFCVVRLDDMHYRVKKGLIPSCGCWSRERRIEISLSLFDASKYMHKRSGRLLVTGIDFDADRKGKNKNRLVCLCDCGAQVVVIPHSIASGYTKSCGCLQSEVTSADTSEREYIHGHTINGELKSGESPLYQCWHSIIKNCRKRALGDNQRVCHDFDPRWNNFLNFLADFGDISASQTIKRKDKYSTWCRENCYVCETQKRLIRDPAFGGAQRLVGSRVS